MKTKKKTPLAGSSPCSATMLDKAMLDRGVQPAALIARLKREIIDVEREAWRYQVNRMYHVADGLRRAIKIIECEANAAERDAAG